MTKPGSKEWHDERRTGIGGSDAAAALGMSKFTTAYQLYLQKIGEAEPEAETWEMSRGKALEPLLRQHYADTTGRAVHVPHSALVHPTYEFMRYNPDGLSDDGRLQEFKTAAYGDGWGEEGSDEVPKEYLIQVQHGMIVTGRDVSDVTVSIAGNKPKSFVVEADKELQEMIIEGEAAFWEAVKARIAPAAVTNDDVAKMYRRVNGMSIAATAAIRAVLGDLHLVRGNIKALESDKEQLEVILKNFMGENETLTDEAGFVPLVTWKQQKGATRIDSDALRKAMPELVASYSKTGEPMRRLLLK